MKPLAVMTDKRVADLPDVPTIAEAGFPEATYVPWYGIYVQAGTPDAIVEKINDGINKALQNPEVQRQLVGRQYSGQADAAQGPRRADEGGSREADEGDRDVGHGAAVMAISSFRGDAKHRTRVRNCAPENLEIPRCAIAHLRPGPSDHPGMTCGHFFTLLASILIDVSSILTENAVSTSNGFSMPR